MGGCKRAACPSGRSSRPVRRYVAEIVGRGRNDMCLPGSNDDGMQRAALRAAADAGR